MTTCKHCRDRIDGEFVRMDAGARFTTGEVMATDVNLHPACYGPWMLVHYPWLTKVTTRVPIAA